MTRLGALTRGFAVCATVLVFFLGLMWAAPTRAAAVEKSAESSPSQSTGRESLRAGFVDPPSSARLRCYWWWLNGHVTPQSIDHDLVEMKAKGYGGALLVDANGADADKNDPVPAGPTFGSPAWTALYLHAAEIAHKLGLEITLTITSGWNLGAPFIQPKDAVKILTWSRALAGETETTLPAPSPKHDFYERIAVLAYPLRHGAKLPGQDGDSRAPRLHLPEKSAAVEIGWSTPESSYLLFDPSGKSGDEDADVEDVRDVTKYAGADGLLHWSPPAPGPWEILTVGYTNSGMKLVPGSGAWQGLSLDPLSPDVLDRYWDREVVPLLKAARPYLGNTIKYVTTDSWEMGGMNWTDNFREEFLKRRGYDPIRYLPVIAGRILTSREVSDRFLADFRRTVGDLINAHFDRMAERAAQFGLGTQCESGGPHGEPIDALETFRHAAIPQTEFWSMSKHRSTFADRYFTKEAASAAHIYGKRYVANEGETGVGNYWSESLSMNLKPSFDMALTEGLNRLMWHQFTSSPAEMGLPGQEYFAGTYLNPEVTWWQQAGAFTAYLNRAQFLMQQGEPIADVLYYYGDQVPNFVRRKSDDPAGVLPGYDYDVVDTDALLHRILFDQNGLHTPEGIRYRMLVLPPWRVMPVSVLELVDRYLRAGGSVVGLRPLRPQGIVSSAEELRYQKVAQQIWSGCDDPSAPVSVHVGRGTLYCKATARNALQTAGVLTDLEATSKDIDYVHRRTGQADIYFVRNTQPKAKETAITFRVENRQPEIFNAVTGEIEPAMLFEQTSDGRIRMHFALKPYGSFFLVFEDPAERMHLIRLERDHQEIALSEDTVVTRRNDQLVLCTDRPGSYQAFFADGSTRSYEVPKIDPLQVTSGWTLEFPPKWGAPSHVDVPALKSWTDFDDQGVRYFSGTAVYHTTIQVNGDQLTAGHELWLDLGDVREIAQIRINGISLTPLWMSPYADRIDKLLRPGENRVDVEVTNFWPNRIIGDLQTGNGEHYTSTNIRAFSKSSPLLPSGLLGPVVLRRVSVLPLATH
jgi:hypothetical protein